MLVKLYDFQDMVFKHDYSAIRNNYGDRRGCMQTVLLWYDKNV